MPKKANKTDSQNGIKSTEFKSRIEKRIRQIILENFTPDETQKQEYGYGQNYIEKHLTF